MTSIPVPTTHDTTSGRESFLPRSIIDPKADRDRGRKVLVVSTIEDAGEKLSRYLTPVDTIKVVVPAVRQGFLDWLANDQGAFAHAEEVAAETTAALPGHSVASSAGEADVPLAIRDALATFPADEILVAVRSDEDSGFVEAMATKDASRRSVDGVPLRCIVVGDDA